MSNTAAVMDAAACDEYHGSRVDSGEQGSVGGMTSENESILQQDMPEERNTTHPKPVLPQLNQSNKEHDPSVEAFSILKEFAILATGPYSPLMQMNLSSTKGAYCVSDAMENDSASQASSDHDSLSEGALSPPLNWSVSLTLKDSKSRERSLNSSTGSAATSPRVSCYSQQHESYIPVAVHHKSPWRPTTLNMSNCWVNGLPSPLLSPADSLLSASPDEQHLVHSVPCSSVLNSIYKADPWRLPWPHPVWHCFEHGTLVRFCISKSQFVLRAEEVEQCRELQFLVPLDRLGPIRVVSIQQVESPDGLVEISFTCGGSGVTEDTQIMAICCSRHTFWVLGKGWCTVSPDSVFHQYGIQCQLLECGDFAQPPQMPGFSSPGISDEFKRFTFSPKKQGLPICNQDSVAVSVIKTQHLQEDEQTSQQHYKLPSLPRSILHKSAKHKKTKVRGLSIRPARALAKHSLNLIRSKRRKAFLLFARLYKLKATRLNSEKDNSVSA